MYDIEPSEVVITGNGVETGFLEAIPDRHKKPHVLYVGRLDIGKGVEELIKAAQVVVQSCPDPDLRFVLVGKGPLLSRLRNLVTKSGLEQQVEFRGYLGADKRDELIELYHQASVFVLPSHHEGMPTVLLEAMATGTASISTAVGGALEVIIDGENGLLVPPRDPDALADAIVRLVTEPELGLKLGRNAHQTVESHFSWTAISERYLGYLRASVARAESRLMKVAFLSSGIEPSLARLQPYRTLLEMGRELDKRGHEVVFISDGASHLPSRYEVTGLSVQRVANVRSFHGRPNPELTETVTAISPDLVLWHLWYRQFCPSATDPYFLATNDWSCHQPGTWFQGYSAYCSKDPGFKY